MISAVIADDEGSDSTSKVVDDGGGVSTDLWEEGERSTSSKKGGDDPDLLATDKWLALVDDDWLSTTEVDDDASDSDDRDEQKVKLDGSTKEDELEGKDGSPLTEVDEHTEDGAPISASGTGGDGRGWCRDSTASFNTSNMRLIRSDRSSGAACWNCNLNMSRSSDFRGNFDAGGK